MQNEFLDLSGFTVLIVDDYSFVSQILSISLREMGVKRIVTAENGEIAKSKLLTLNSTENGNNVDVIIMDWLMPVMDGRALLKWVRGHAKEKIRFLPVIVCSAYTSSDLVNESRDMGANEVIVKPVSAAAIAHRIQHVINHPRAFVKSKTYFGPERRRQNKPLECEDRRKARPQDVKTNYEQK